MIASNIIVSMECMESMEYVESMENVKSMEPLGQIDVFVEISKNSHIKYEYDKTLNALRCDRILHTPLKYNFNYGFIPNTLSDDGDPLDVVLLMEDELVPGSYIKCEILGCLDTSDDEGNDPKIIACPIAKIDPTYKDVCDLNDVPIHTLDKIEYFFSHYKDLENKKVKIGNFLNKEIAIAIYEKSKQKFIKNKTT
jgi:inorganic pyrophosphatase